MGLRSFAPSDQTQKGRSAVKHPDGYFFEGHLCFSDPGRGCVLAKGYIIDYPDLSASNDQAVMNLMSDLRRLFGD